MVKQFAERNRRSSLALHPAYVLDDSLQAVRSATQPMCRNVHIGFGGTLIFALSLKFVESFNSPFNYSCVPLL